VALRGDGTVWIWGANLHLIEPLPRQVLELPLGILQVATGGGASFAVSADRNSLWAWGLNEKGQLGDRTTTAGARPVKISLPDVHQIVATDGSTAAVIRTKSGGTLWA
jgi:alpha-tubulin suppressor-like RCC1 family protein